MKPYSWWGVYYASIPRTLYEGHIAFLAAMLEHDLPSWKDLTDKDRQNWDRLITSVGIQSGAQDHVRFLDAWQWVYSGMNAPRGSETFSAMWKSLSWTEQQALRMLNGHYNALTQAFHDLRLPYTHEGLHDFVDPRPEAK